jgi:hypothetical protein|tara:strand:- start:595 stop:1122 length:528 start_codon:yes stop_codon:yes gene_type:complete
MFLNSNIMKRIIGFLVLLFVLIGCEPPMPIVPFVHEDWTNRILKANQIDSLELGKTYLSIYSQVYSRNKDIKHNLTAVASLRNTSDSDTIYIVAANYYDTHGALVHVYIDDPIFLGPFETTEIVIEEHDIAGGTGSNFLFEWKAPAGCPDPLFEGVMISTLGQQGLSYITHGVKI